MSRRRADRDGGVRHGVELGLHGGRRAAVWLAAGALLALSGCIPGPRSDTPRAAGGPGPEIRIALATVPAAEAPSPRAANGGGLVRFRGKSYRGSLQAIPTDTGVLVVNVIALEDYLLGVVPLELGERPTAERAALEAQAIAARSFTVIRLNAARNGRGRSPHFDLVGTTSDQVYGGADAEQPNASAAVRATAGLVLTYGGRVIEAPYHSTCGGETAGAEEVWQTPHPYLRRVSDRIPGSRNRYYCDIAPRFYWERTLSGPDLNQVVARYLGSYTDVPPGGPGDVRDVRIVRRTASGRADVVAFRTARGTFELRGNTARSVLRTTAGELMPSSYFSVSITPSASGGIERALLRGNGFGHGVGMCQWGAIGRARAGQGAAQILRTYFPGTSVAPLRSSQIVL
ncbi:MAG: SpoIID/LytB domain-containing protein [Gemmatimonadaceae bacterium]|nr:SpoIID/LytB domain-containing protein [Gemmatimonadaceae bacterium]